MDEKKDTPSIELNSAPFVVSMLAETPTLESGKALKAGDPCPKCCTGQLDYDGCLNLACPVCGYAMGGCFT